MEEVGSGWLHGEEGAVPAEGTPPGKAQRPVALRLL